MMYSQIRLVIVAGLLTSIVASPGFSFGDFEFINLSRMIRSSDNSDDDNSDSVQTFNRPPGTRALAVEVNNVAPSDLYGRTFGQYGSYRNHQSWQNAVHADRRRHSLIQRNLRDTFPWLFKNLKTPSISGFSLNGFWNSYAPAVPHI